MNDKFENVWNSRNDIEPCMMKDWSKGRNEYLTFLVKVKHESIVEKIIATQNELSKIPCIDPFPREYFHITVKECGFLAESKTYEDDVLIDDLQKIINQAKQILQRFKKFKGFLSKLNLFPGVVFVQVYDEGKIGELNKELQSITEIKKMEFDYPNFLPHISIAQFQSNRGFDRLISYLEKIRDMEFGVMTVDSIELVIAYLHKRYPKLETIHTFGLK